MEPNGSECRRPFDWEVSMNEIERLALTEEQRRIKLNAVLGRGGPSFRTANTPSLFSGHMMNAGASAYRGCAPAAPPLSSFNPALQFDSASILIQVFSDLRWSDRHTRGEGRPKGKSDIGERRGITRPCPPYLATEGGVRTSNRIELGRRSEEL